MLGIESPTEKRKGGKNRDERVLYALERGGGGKQSPTEKRKGGEETEKKHRRESFICSENGGKTESNRDEKQGKKNREERVLYALKRGKKTENPTEKRKGVKK